MVVAGILGEPESRAQRSMRTANLPELSELPEMCGNVREWALGGSMGKPRFRELIQREMDRMPKGESRQKMIELMHRY
jgi:hypothetical protein